MVAVLLVGIAVFAFAYLAGRRSAPASVQVLREARPVFSGDQQQQLYTWFHGRCAYCGAAIPPREDWHIDHVKPWSLGGSNEPHNLALACRPCNTSKGSKTDWVIKFPAKGPTPTFGTVVIQPDRQASLVNLARRALSLRIPSTLLWIAVAIEGSAFVWLGLTSGDNGLALFGLAFLAGAYYLRKRNTKTTGRSRKRKKR